MICNNKAKGVYLYLSTVATDHINHFDIRAFFHWLIKLNKKEQSHKP